MCQGRRNDILEEIWIGTDGGVERIGAYVKELSAIDYDLLILNKALVMKVTLRLRWCLSPSEWMYLRSRLMRIKSL